MLRFENHEAIEYQYPGMKPLLQLRDMTRFLRF